MKLKIFVEDDKRRTSKPKQTGILGMAQGTRKEERKRARHTRRG